MSFKSQTASRRGAARQYSRSAHEKRVKERKQRIGGKYLLEEIPEVTAKDAAEKTIGTLTKLGNQIFALSPFSQYFDDWLVSLRQTISEFEW
jgi:hypothetical protein